MAVSTHNGSTAEQRAMMVSYLNLRGAIGLFAIALPVVVVSVGLSLGEPLRSSISSYYHYAPTRDIFVAILCAIGVFLGCYSGYSDQAWYKNELGIHKLMGISAVLVGLCPTFQTGVTAGPYLELLASVHIGAAATLMLAMAITALWMFPNNQGATQFQGDSAAVQRTKATNAWVYRACGLWIVGALLYFARHRIFTSRSPGDATLFYVEWVAIWGFGVAWLWKSHWLSSAAAIIAERVTSRTSSP